jgi:hypothetical protein
MTSFDRKGGSSYHSAEPSAGIAECSVDRSMNPDHALVDVRLNVSRDRTGRLIRSV